MAVPCAGCSWTYVAGVRFPVALAMLANDLAKRAPNLGARRRGLPPTSEATTLASNRRAKRVLASGPLSAEFFLKPRDLFLAHGRSVFPFLGG
jgi:hypothetical protein